MCVHASVCILCRPCGCVRLGVHMHMCLGRVFARVYVRPEEPSIREECFCLVPNSRKRQPHFQIKVDSVIGMFLLSRDSFDKYVCQQALG